MKYKVAEIFQSINGEGMKAGELAVFVRFCGCNLHCRYCDTMWANLPGAPFTEMGTEEILRQVCRYPAKNVTVTGGEPLLQKGILGFFRHLAEEGYSVEVETNGSVPLREWIDQTPEVSFTMDYKLAGSGMEGSMDCGNFALLREKDTVKFVVSGREDLERAYEIAERYALGGRCHILLSPVFGEAVPEEIVEFMKEKGWTGARMQLQIHKIIWEPQKRGV